MSYKALELSAELADRLRKRVSDYASITEAFDANGNPTIALNDGTPATTEDAVFIRVEPRSWTLTKDVLGLAQTVYTPHVCKIAAEGPASGVGLGRFVSVAHLFAILLTAGEFGMRTEYWEEPNGNPPAVTTFDTAGNFKTAWESLYYPLLSSQ